VKAHRRVGEIGSDHVLVRQMATVGANQVPTDARQGEARGRGQPAFAAGSHHAGSRNRASGDVESPCLVISTADRGSGRGVMLPACFSGKVSAFPDVRVTSAHGEALSISSVFTAL
tara:strand:- start:3419 stop:3766 length:348 start_codon:yes stop_codon:yes gene_type:complete